MDICSILQTSEIGVHGLPAWSYQLQSMFRLMLHAGTGAGRPWVCSTGTRQRRPRRRPRSAVWQPGFTGGRTWRHATRATAPTTATTAAIWAGPSAEQRCQPGARGVPAAGRQQRCQRGPQQQHWQQPQGTVETACMCALGQAYTCCLCEIATTHPAMPGSLIHASHWSKHILPPMGRQSAARHLCHRQHRRCKVCGGPPGVPVWRQRLPAKGEPRPLCFTCACPASRCPVFCPCKGSHPLQQSIIIRGMPRMQQQTSSAAGAVRRQWQRRSRQRWRGHAAARQRYQPREPAAPRGSR